MKNTRKNSLTYFLWALGDIEIINAIAKSYAAGQERSRTRMGFSLVITGILTVAFGAGTWIFDIQPTRDFVFEVAHRVGASKCCRKERTPGKVRGASLPPQNQEFQMKFSTETLNQVAELLLADWEDQGLGVSEMTATEIEYALQEGLRPSRRVTPFKKGY